MQPRATSARQILVVKDDPGIRDVVAFHLGLARYDITTVEDGKAALVLLQTRPFDGWTRPSRLTERVRFGFCPLLKTKNLAGFRFLTIC